MGLFFLANQYPEAAAGDFLQGLSGQGGGGGGYFAFLSAYLGVFVDLGRASPSLED